MMSDQFLEVLRDNPTSTGGKDIADKQDPHGKRENTKSVACERFPLSTVIDP
jgi:hypothetical protein